MAAKLFLTDINLNGNRILNFEIDLSTSQSLSQKFNEVTIVAADKSVVVTPGTTVEGTTTSTTISANVKSGTNDLKLDANNGLYVTPYTGDGSTIEITNNQIKVKDNTFDSKGSAATAEQNAKDYATGLKNDVVGTASDTKDASTIIGAKKYADDKASNLVGASTDTKNANTIYGAKAYADDVAASAVGDAVSDLIGTSEDLKTDNTIYGAKIYADDAADTAKTEAISTVVGTNSDTSSSDTVKGAKKYTDEAVASLDASVSAGTLGQAGSTIAGVQVLTGVTEVDGILTGVSDAAADAYGSAQKALDDAKAYTDDEIADLDVNDTAVANQFVTEVKEVDGKVQIQRARPSAANISVAALDNIPAGDLQTVLGTLEDAIDAGGTGSVVTLDEEAGTGDVLKVYTLSQGGNVVGTINIPKDLVVSNGRIVTGTWSGNTFTPDATQPGSGSDKALELTIANQSNPIYINVADLVDAYTGGNGIEISAANVVSLKLDSTTESFLTLSNGGLKLSGIQTAIDNAIADLDSSVTVGTLGSAGSTIAGVQVLTGVTEVDGVLTSKTDVAADAYGSAQKALDDAKAYADGKITGLTETTRSASGTPVQSGTMVVSSVTTENGQVKSVGSIEVESAGAAATAEQNAKDYTDAEIAKLDASISANTTAPSAPATPAIAGVNVLTGVTEVDGKLTTKTDVAVDAWGSAQKALNDAKAYTDEVVQDAVGSGIHSYIVTASTGNSVTILKADHKCGDYPIVACYLGGQEVMCNVAIASGNVTVSWNGTLSDTITVKLVG